MKSPKAYLCKECGKTVYIQKETEEKPECCGKPMAFHDLDSCQKTLTAEHERLYDEDKPCDNGIH